MKLLLAIAALALGSAAMAREDVHRIVLAPGDTIAATVDGERGEAIVFVPGLLGNAYGFRNLTDPLVAAGYRTLIFEPLGTGASSKPQKSDYSLEAQARRLLAVLDEMDVPRAHLVCHSVGASICMR